jgi:hypothetical protein
MKTNRTEHDVDRAGEPTALEMPRQVPPVDRTEAVSAGTYGDTAGVEADGFLDDVLQFIQS